MKTENLEAKRALFAFKAAEKGNKKQADSQNKFNYSAAVQELPTILRMNGLRATMAFFYSKEGQHRMVFDNLVSWFKLEDEPTKFMQAKLKEKSEAKDFMNILLHLSDNEYRIVQAETLTLANWLIRFVKTENSKTSTPKPEGDEQPQI